MTGSTVKGSAKCAQHTNRTSVGIISTAEEKFLASGTSVKFVTRTNGANGWICRQNVDGKKTKLEI